MSLIHNVVEQRNLAFDRRILFMWKRIDEAACPQYRSNLLTLSQSLLSNMVNEAGARHRVLRSHVNALQNLLHSLAHVASKPMKFDGIKVSLRPISFGKNGKDYPGLSFHPFRLVLNLLDECGYCDVEKGFKSEHVSSRTVVKPTSRLADLMLRNGLLWPSHPFPVEIEPASPVLMVNVHPKKRGKDLRPLDRPMTGLESVLPRLNALLGRTQIGIAWSSYEDYEASFDRAKGYSRAHSNRTHFYRSFRFEDGIGGRLAGHWLPSAPKAIRKLVTFNGIPTVELDFKSFHPVLAYDRAGIAIPSDDLYAVPGWPKTEESRAKFKLIWNKSVNTKKAILTGADIERSGMSRVKRGRRAIRFGPGEAQQMMDAFWDCHAPLRHLIGSEAWKDLQFRESEIMLHILSILVDQGVPAVPIHDSLRVAETHAADLYNAMRQATAHMITPPAISGYEPTEPTWH